MEKFVLILCSFLLVFLFLRLMVIPIRSILRIGIHSTGGLVCLMLLNTVSAFTGILFPLNAVTVAVAGFGGLPGIAAIALLAWLA